MGKRKQNIRVGCFARRLFIYPASLKHFLSLPPIPWTQHISLPMPWSAKECDGEFFPWPRFQTDIHSKFNPFPMTKVCPNVVSPLTKSFVHMQEHSCLTLVLLDSVSNTSEVSCLVSPEIPSTVPDTMLLFYLFIFFATTQSNNSCFR